MKRRVIFVLIAALPLFSLLRALAQAPNARITGFTAPNTDSAGRKAVIKGDAEPARAGIYTIRKLHIDNYRADGQLDSTIDSSECLFDYKGTHDVWSDKDLTLKTIDARLLQIGRAHVRTPVTS